MNNWRLYIVFFLILFAGAWIIARMFYIQVVKNGYYAALAKGQYAQPSFAAKRGNIFFEDRYSRNGSGLFLAATQKDWFALYAVPKEILDARDVSASIAPVLEGLRKESASSSKPHAHTEVLNPEEEEEEELYERLSKKDDPYEPLTNKLNEEQAEKVSSLGIKGIYTKREPLRYYPGKSLASHVLGFLGYEGEERAGQYGVEGYHDNVLREGNGLILSLDYNIQVMVENELTAAKEKFAAEGGSAIIVDPKTGEIIALASAKPFDPNAYFEVENVDVFLNDAAQKMFEPGSIFKPFTMSAALDVGVVTPVTEYIDRGYVTIWDRTFKNANERVFGRQNMTNILEFSINTGAVFAEQQIGHEKFREYIQRFGFGQRTGIDLQGEITGNIENVLYTLRDVNFATASFGQGIAVTPIQFVSAFSAFANGGKIMKPHLRKTLEPEVIKEPISAKTAAQITAMLMSAVENGYGKKAQVNGYTVAGKTGTAQVPDREKGGYSEKTIHSFIGFAPVYNPRFVALLKLDNPKGVNFADSSVAPLFSKIAEYILNYYEIPPDK